MATSTYTNAAYATAQDYRDALDKTDAGADGSIAQDLLAISRMLDRKIGRCFALGPANEARVFVPHVGGSLYPTAGAGLSLGLAMPLDWAESENPFRYGGWARYLYIDDLASAPASVIVDADADGTFNDAAVAATDYELLPRNALKGPEPEPYTALHVPNWSTIGGWAAGRRVQIVGQWGWPAVPAAVRSATIQLCGILRLESPRATSRVSEMGETVATSRVGQMIVDELIAGYRNRARII